MDMVLGPTRGPLDDEQVVAAYPWPDDGRWVRAMMVTTLDGAAVGPDSLSGSISGDADRRVFDAVRTAIMEGRIAPDTRLTERELCEAFGISRTVVREVARRLEAEKLVTVIPHSGLRVARELGVRPE